MNRPTTYRRAAVKRKIRTARTGPAREAIGTLHQGDEIYILTHGQFSLIDALVAIVEQTGPADVTLATWTAATADLTVAARLVEASRIRSMRFIVDNSFIARQPEYCAEMRRVFGDECIRTTKTHAKFAAIRNDDWAIAVRTSMNLNENLRLENIEISVDSDLCGFLEAFADELFHDQQPGLFDGALPAVPRERAVTAESIPVRHLRPASVGPRTR